MVRQSMAGEVRACLRVGALAPGHYRVALDQVLSIKGQMAAATGSKVADGQAAGPPVRLTVSPASGRPGTTVWVTGTLTSALPRQPGHAGLCWDGCRDGLQYAGVALRWSSPTAFRARMVVPGGPWIEGGPARVARLVPGHYRIGVQCLAAVKGCGLGGAEGSVSFGLQVPASAGSRCPTAASCAALAVDPAAAAPGQVVRVTGFAPLVSVIGSDQPFAFQLQVLPGRPEGPEVAFMTPNARGGILVRLGHGALRVEPPSSFAALGSTAPIAQSAGGLAVVSADPADPGRVAWCAGTSVMVEGGGTKVAVPTAPAAAVLVHMGFGLFGGPAPRCVAVAPAGASGGPSAGDQAGSLAAAFVVEPRGEAPPFADVALFTTDGGRSWTPVPAPPGASPATFGGFRYRRGGLDALFASSSTGSATGASASPAPLVETTSDGGLRWRPGGLSCPEQGPCVNFGAYLPGNCAMHGTAQALLRSTDGGRHWAEVGWPSTVQACAPARLVATSAGTELLVDSSSPYTLRRSIDGGATWADIALPPLPGQQPATGPGRGPAGITVVPDGSLLATGQRGSQGSWELLRPGSASWCQVRGLGAGVARSTALAPVTLVAGQLWWLSGNDGSMPAAHHLDVARLSC